MARVNEDLRIEIVRRDLTYREIAEHMGISRFWLSKVMSRRLTPKMRSRIVAAIDALDTGEKRMA